jgi:hypothetical protein
MEFEDSLSNSQFSAIGSYPEPVESGSHPRQNNLFNIPYNVSHSYNFLGLWLLFSIFAATLLQNISSSCYQSIR